MHLPENISEQLNGKKALVTGGTGMIGREVVRLLIASGCSVTCVSLDDIQPHPGVDYVKGDLSSFELCQDLCSDKDFLFHIAGIKGSVVVTEAKPASFFVPLLMMNTNVIEASRRANVGKCLYTSSIGAYSSAEIFVESENDYSKPPMDMYPGWAKRMAEFQIQTYAKQYSLHNYAIVRPSNIYGPGDNFDVENAMVIPTLMARIARGDNPVMIWGDGTAERDFLHATDAAVGMILACLKGTEGKPLNLGCGYGISIKELVQALQSFIEFEAFYDITKPSGFPRRIMDISLANKLIGFKPKISLVDGLTGTWNWYKENIEEHKNKQNYFR